MLRAIFAYGQRHPIWFAGTILISLFVFGISAASAVSLLFGYSSDALKYGFAAGLVGFAATGLGSTPGLFVKKLPQALEDGLLGWSAGMMLAASVFSLLLPAIESSEKFFPNSQLGAMIFVVFGMALGVLLLLLIEEMTPHAHTEVGHQGPSVPNIAGIWLFVFAIIIHNFPEGMALGISFGEADLSVGVPLTVAIALQDMPEGLAIVLALRATGISNKKAVAIGVASGLMEPIGALFGAGIASWFPLAYPLGLALSAGAMIFVVSHEVIPETHRNGHQTPATIGLMIGFCLMMVLDKLV